MKIKELIAILQEHNPDDQVIVSCELDDDTVVFQDPAYATLVDEGCVILNTVMR